MKKKLLMLITALVMIATLCVGLVACNKTLDTPTNVKVDGDTLKWDAVEGAETYTVKINSDETTKVSTTSLDLTTATVKAKLKSGENTLSVKANEAGKLGESEYSETVKYNYTPAPTPFGAPTNVRVEGDTLKWTAVTGATNGYTVKINDSDTNTVTATTNELDLTTVTTKLVSGNNTLAVKVNAAGNNLESPYAEASTPYNYTPSVEKEISDLAALVEDFETALATYNANKTVANAQAVSDAITAVINKYEGISTEAKNDQQVISAKADFESKAAVFQAEVAQAQTAYAAFTEALNDVLAEIAKEESLTALNQKNAALVEAKNALSGLALNMITPEQEAKGAEIQQAWTTWTTAISTAVSELETAANALPELTDDESAEAIIVATAATIATYQNYKAYVKADTNVAAKYAEITQAKSDAEGQIETSVTALKADVDAALEVDGTLLEQYEALIAVQQDVEALGAYATELYNNYKMNDVQDAIDEILATPVDEKDDVETFIDGANGTVTILYKAVNILGDAISGSAPALTVTIDDAFGEKNPEADWTEADGVFYYTVDFTKKAKESDDASAYVLKVTYQIGENPEKVVTYASFNDDIYFNPGEYKAIVNDKIQFSGAAGIQAYFDIYESKSIDRGTSLPSITAFPLISGVMVTNGMTVTEFRSMLARNPQYSAILLNKTYEVRFVVYNKTVNGSIEMSNIKTALVSADTYTLDLTENDTHLDIFNIPNGGAFNWELQDGTENRIKYAWEIINNATLWDGVDIYVYDTYGIDNVDEYDFLNGSTPFAIYHVSSGGYVSWTPIDEAITQAWKALSDAEREMQYTFVFAMRVTPNETATELGYTASLLNYAAKDGSRQTKDYNMAMEITSSVIDNGIWDNGDFTLIAGTETVNTWLAQFNNLIDGIVLTADNASDYLAVLVEIYTTDNTDLAAYSYLAPFQSRGFNHNTLLKLWAKYYFEHDGVDGTSVTYTMKLSVVLRETVGDTNEPNELRKYFATSQSVQAAGGERSYTFERSALTPSSDIQLRFTTSDGGCFEFLRTSGGNGSIFAMGIDYVTMKWEKDGQSYYAYLFAEDDGALKMYKDTDKSGTSLHCGTVGNGWLHVSEFITWVQANYQDLAEEFSFVDWDFSTQAHSDGSYYLQDGSYSDTTNWNTETSNTPLA